MKLTKKIINTLFLGLLMITLAFIESKAQLNPMGSAWFQNQYLLNPALAGRQQQLNLNGGIRQQFSGMPGAPYTQSLTADYGISNKAGVGLLLYNDRAGVLTRTRAAGSFAYHLPLNTNNANLSFGVLLSFAKDRIEQSSVRGDMDDPDLYDVNQRDAYLDGDFGIAYTSNKLQVQATVPNMKQLFKKDDLEVVDQAVFFSAISYRIETGLGNLEPKVIYRGVKGYDNLLDAGANMEFKSTTVNTLNMFAMYHSAKSATFGMGITWNKALAINGMYTVNTSAMQGYVNGNFELGVSYSLFKK